MLEETFRHLDPDELTAVKALSVLRGCSSRYLGPLTRLCQARLDRVLAGLVSSGLVHVEGSELTRFSHNLFGEFVYERLTAEEREDLHGRLATYLLDSAAASTVGSSGIEATAATHCGSGGQPRRAVELSLSAASRLVDSGRIGQACELTRLAEGLAALGDDRSPSGASTARRLAELYWRTGRARDAAHMYERALVGGSWPSEILVELRWRWGRALALAGRPEESEKVLEEALVEAEGMADVRWIARIYSSLGILLQMKGRFEEIGGLADKGISLLRDASEPQSLASCYNAKGNSLLARCRWREAGAAYQEVLGLSATAGDHPLAALAKGNLGLVAFYLGEWRRADTLFEEAFALASQLGSSYCMSVVARSLGVLRLRQGDVDAAERLLLDAEAHAREAGDAWGRALTLSDLGHMASETGWQGRALSHYDESLEIMARIGCIDDLAETLRRRAHCLLRLGHVGKARSILVRACDLASSLGNPLEEANCQRALGAAEAESGDLDTARERCEASLRSLTHLGAMYEMGRTLVVNAKVLGEMEEDAQATAALEKAHDLFHSLGARRDAQRTHESLLVARQRIAPFRSGLPRDVWQLEAIYAAGRILSGGASPPEMAEELAGLVSASVRAEAAFVVLSDGGSGESSCAAASPSVCCDATKVTSLVRPLLDEVGAESKMLDIKDFDSMLHDLAPELSASHFLVAPMRTCERGIGGIVVCCSRQTESGVARDLRFLDALAVQAAPALENVLLRSKLAAEVEQLRWEVDGRYSFSNIVGKSVEMQELFNLLQKVAETSATVLIEGESGTGKELVAKAIHHNSQRRESSFIAQNCAALPEQLLESELFGHIRGAFTGAVKDKRGLFEAADGGTFFLDEIADMPSSLQVKLLRVLQDGEIRRVGAVESTTVDVRIIAATNKPLREEVRSGRFREDLYYRLDVVRVSMPPLRDRRDDIPLLAQHFLDHFSGECGKGIEGFTTGAMERFMNFDWPGNVRELENEVERAVALTARGKPIRLSVLSPRLQSTEVTIGVPSPSGRPPLKEIVADMERRIIEQTLRDHGWNKSRAARELGLSRQGLLKKMDRYGLSRRARGGDKGE